ncbi:hypothetical protein BR93DRAFT_169414 [Coniochaeta sp. PMI_546]|nr:hypothetical protein BR93DRAFT_169414 [Coniochaeta sp. PMI_546]
MEELSAQVGNRSKPPNTSGRDSASNQSSRTPMTTRSRGKQASSGSPPVPRVHTSRSQEIQASTPALFNDKHDDAGASSRLRPLLPATGPRSGPNPIPLPHRKRSSVRVACSACQKARTKCTGDRPACYRCLAKGVDCVYNAQSRQFRTSAQLEQASRIADENTQLHELLSYLRTRTWTEAVEVLRRIREAPDLGQAIQFIRDADLMLQQR